MFYNFLTTVSIWTKWEVLPDQERSGEMQAPRALRNVQDATGKEGYNYIYISKFLIFLDTEFDILEMQI